MITIKLLCIQYEIDGRDPNGYVGCMWSICGVHDQVWLRHFVSLLMLRLMSHDVPPWVFRFSAIVLSLLPNVPFQGWRERPVFGKIRYMELRRLQRENLMLMDTLLTLRGKLVKSRREKPKPCSTKMKKNFAFNPIYLDMKYNLQHQVLAGGGRF